MRMIWMISLILMINSKTRCKLKTTCWGKMIYRLIAPKNRTIKILIIFLILRLKNLTLIIKEASMLGEMSQTYPTNS